MEAVVADLLENLASHGVKFRKKRAQRTQRSVFREYLAGFVVSPHSCTWCPWVPGRERHHARMFVLLATQPVRELPTDPPLLCYVLCALPVHVTCACLQSGACKPVHLRLQSVEVGVVKGWRANVQLEDMRQTLSRGFLSHLTHSFFVQRTFNIRVPAGAAKKVCGCLRHSPAPSCSNSGRALWFFLAHACEPPSPPPPPAPCCETR